MYNYEKTDLLSGPTLLNLLANKQGQELGFQSSKVNMYYKCPNVVKEPCWVPNNNCSNISIRNAASLTLRQSAAPVAML